jgi:AcrR family transcriptional regulator
MEVFWQHGYEDASIAALTAAMGIGPPSLYAAFGSKEELFRAAVALYGETEGQVTERALRDHPTARASVEALLRDNAVGYTEPGRPAGCMIVNSAASVSPSHRGIRDHLAECRQTVEADIERRVRRGIEEGDVPAGADAEAIAIFYYTVHEGLSHQARDGAPRAKLESIAASAMAAWDALIERSVAPG